MSRGKKLSADEKLEILSLREKGKSYREISTIIGRSLCVISLFLKNPQKYGKNHAGGHPKVLTLRDERAIIRRASNQVVSVRNIKSDLNLQASKETIRKVLASNSNIKCKKMKGKPCLNKQHKSKRLQWAAAHQTWNHEWRNVIFSDEKRFNLDGPDGYSYYWHDLRKEPRIFNKHHSRVGSLMVWAGFSFNGRTDIAILNGKQNAINYQNVLQEYLLPVWDEISGENGIFVQDNASIHTANTTKTWLQDNDISLGDHPSLSPDLNPIENLWSVLVRAVYSNGRQFQNVGDLEIAIKREWQKIPIELLQTLIDSMKSRVFEVITAGGSWTKY